jgi:hypothetical protein
MYKHPDFIPVLSPAKRRLLQGTEDKPPGGAAAEKPE